LSNHVVQDFILEADIYPYDKDNLSFHDNNKICFYYQKRTLDSRLRCCNYSHILFDNPDDLLRIGKMN